VRNPQQKRVSLPFFYKTLRKKGELAGGGKRGREQEKGRARSGKTSQGADIGLVQTKERGSRGVMGGERITHNLFSTGGGKLGEESREGLLGGNKKSATRPLCLTCKKNSRKKK